MPSLKLFLCWRCIYVEGYEIQSLCACKLPCGLPEGTLLSAPVMLLRDRCKAQCKRVPSVSDGFVMIECRLLDDC